MSSGYIVFCYAHCDFLVPLEQFHIILNPEEVLDKTGVDESDIDKVTFGDKFIKIIHLSKYLKTEPIKISSSSRLLVGEFYGQFIGFWVGNITEIINVESDKFLQINSEEDELVIKVKIEGLDYNLINLNNVIDKKIEINDGVN